MKNIINYGPRKNGHCELGFNQRCWGRFGTEWRLELDEGPIEAIIEDLEKRGYDKKAKNPPPIWITVYHPNTVDYDLKKIDFNNPPELQRPKILVSCLTYERSYRKSIRLEERCHDCEFYIKDGSFQKIADKLMMDMIPKDSSGRAYIFPEVQTLREI